MVRKYLGDRGACIYLEHGNISFGEIKNLFTCKNLSAHVACLLS